MKVSSEIFNLLAKNLIRPGLKERILKITGRIEKDRAIISSLSAIIGGQIRHIIIYQADKFEVSPALLPEKFPFVRFYYPKVLNSTEMAFICPETWEKGPQGILQPESGIEIMPCDADLIIIPALGYNENAFRLGRGAGYYDRKLAGISPEKMIGLTYEELFPVSFKEDAYDIQAGILVTEKRIRHFR